MKRFRKCLRFERPGWRQGIAFTGSSLFLAVLFLLLCRAAGAGELHDAVRGRDVAAVLAVIEKDASAVKSTTEDGATPLHIAASMNSKGLVEMLVLAGADVNARTKTGATPLHWAALENARDAVEMLLKKGADPALRTDEGQTALAVARAKGATRAAEALAGAERERGAAVLSSPQFIEARNALAGGDAMRAMDILMGVFRENPGNREINFALGQAAFAAGKYSHASLAFERMLAADPDNDRIRLELARSYYAARQFGLSRNEFEKVLARNPPEHVRANVDAFLADIRKSEKRWGFSGRIDVSGMWDDNCNVGPSSDLIQIAPIVSGASTIEELRVSEGTKPVESLGVSALASGSAVYDAGRRGRWGVFGGITAYNSWLETHARDEETLFCEAGMGLQRGGERDLLRIPLKFNHISHGHEALVNMYGAGVSYLRSLGSGRIWYMLARLDGEYRDYPTLDDRDGPYGVLSCEFGRYFKEPSGSISARAEAFYEKTAAACYENAGGNIVVSGEIAAPLRAFAYVQGKIRYARYKEREALAPDDRRDNMYQLTVGIRRNIARRLGADVSWQLTRNDSTFDLYEYDRNIVTAGVSYAF